MTGWTTVGENKNHICIIYVDVARSIANIVTMINTVLPRYYVNDCLVCILRLSACSSMFPLLWFR